jgi:hypothetical protein
MRLAALAKTIEGVAFASVFHLSIFAKISVFICSSMWFLKIKKNNIDKNNF